MRGGLFLARGISLAGQVAAAGGSFAGHGDRVGIAGADHLAPEADRRPDAVRAGAVLLELAHRSPIGAAELASTMGLGPAIVTGDLKTLAAEGLAITTRSGDRWAISIEGAQLAARAKDP